jgi:UDP-glucose 6-dehydrogenase
MEVAILGSGCFGLVNRARLAEDGDHVACIDVDQSRIDRSK